MSRSGPVGDNWPVNGGRLALVVTCLVVAGAGVWLAIARWEDANKLATVLSALGAVAAVGVAVWAALRGSSQSARASRTGSAAAGYGGVANTGVQGTVSGDVRVSRTGDAQVEGDGQANTGVRE